MPSVKIAIDIRRMTEFGVGTYIRNVVRTLGRLDRENNYFLIGPPAKVQEIGPATAQFPDRPTAGARALDRRVTASSATRSEAASTAIWSTFQICFRFRDVCRAPM